MRKWFSAFGSSRMLLAVFTIKLPVETPRTLFPPVHGGGRIINAVDPVSQDSRPHLVQLQWLAQELRGCVGFSKLTQLTRDHLEQAQQWSN
jgi:hypothetical protein